MDHAEAIVKVATALTEITEKITNWQEKVESRLDALEGRVEILGADLDSSFMREIEDEDKQPEPDEEFPEDPVTLESVHKVQVFWFDEHQRRLNSHGARLDLIEKAAKATRKNLAQLHTEAHVPDWRAGEQPEPEEEEIPMPDEDWRQVEEWEDLLADIKNDIEEWPHSSDTKAETALAKLVVQERKRANRAARSVESRDRDAVRFMKERDRYKAAFEELVAAVRRGRIAHMPDQTHIPQIGKGWLDALEKRAKGEEA